MSQAEPEKKESLQVKPVEISKPESFPEEQPCGVVQHATPPQRPAGAEQAAQPGPAALQVMLNGRTLLLPGKPEGAPYYVMDLLEHSGIDFEHLDRGVELQVNGTECAFTQVLHSQDDVVIRYLET